MYIYRHRCSFASAFSVCKNYKQSADVFIHTWCLPAFHACRFDYLMCMKYQNTIEFLEGIALFFLSQVNFCLIFFSSSSSYTLVRYLVSFLFCTHPLCSSLEILSEAATRGQHDCISSRKTALGFPFSWQVWGPLLRTKHIITERLNPQWQTL